MVCWSSLDMKMQKVRGHVQKSAMNDLQCFSKIFKSHYFTIIFTCIIIVFNCKSYTFFIIDVWESLHFIHLHVMHWCIVIQNCGVLRGNWVRWHHPPTPPKKIKKEANGLYRSPEEKLPLFSSDQLKNYGT